MSQEDKFNISETWFANLRSRIINRNVGIFTFFLLLAFVFWFLNALSKDMTGRIKYPVRYTDFPKEMALLNELPQELDLTLEGPGYSILKTRLSGNKPPVIIDVSDMNYTMVEDGSRFRLFVLTYGLRDMIKRQMRAEFDITEINPDTITFEFDKLTRKKVPVVANVDVSTQRQFMVNGDITCMPDSVLISGPESIIDTIDLLLTRHEKFVQLNQTHTATLIVESIPKISISQKKVEVTIPVEQYTEAVFTLLIKLINVPDTARIRLFPDRINIQCIVPLSDYNKLADAPLEAVIDFAGIVVRSTSRLKVEVRNIPDYIGSFKYNPEQVEYLIEKL
ncbi:MAG TPA: hypothetical protein VMW76_09895 [Bacteroidales bacterium]|nr:hypothetical protein [Bacteroidales bacterium]